MYSVSLTTADGKTRSADTADILSALDSMRPEEQIKGKVVVKVANGAKEVCRVVNVPHAKKLFGNFAALEYFARNLSRSF